MIVTVAGEGSLSVSKIIGYILQRTAAHGKAQHQQVVGISHRNLKAGAPQFGLAALGQSIGGNDGNGEILRRVVIGPVAGHGVAADDLAHIGRIVKILGILRSLDLVNARAQAPHRDTAAGNQTHIAAIHRGDMPLRQGIHTDGHMVQHIVSADDPADNAAKMGCSCGSGSSGVDGTGNPIGAEHTA